MFSHYSPFLFWEKEKFSDSELGIFLFTFTLFYKSKLLVSGRKPLVYFLLH
ncbi:hypothetical protein LEP1GSC116_3154 [Leptospira interrogans serovar Icterohaemorrhagiae str. Verdun HP]|uniref:Uncharacterized protein n=1 Tax=Leptospira interrogans serovar Icterohaemorrhagiae str. Verdun HP TaxID=1049910 RepID=M6RJW1_LEPIR|nr:hypothetical protein LEP1GSC116_3154 [Leptospira interrogans serovar Icterohaemorrhagiae str. Verdun HP]